MVSEPVLEFRHESLAEAFRLGRTGTRSGGFSFLQSGRRFRIFVLGRRR